MYIRFCWLFFWPYVWPVWFFIIGSGTRSSADELYAGEKSRHTDVMATSTDGIAAMAGYEISY